MEFKRGDVVCSNIYSDHLYYIWLHQSGGSQKSYYRWLGEQEMGLAPLDKRCKDCNCIH